MTDFIEDEGTSEEADRTESSEDAAAADSHVDTESAPEETVDDSAEETFGEVGGVEEPVGTDSETSSQVEPSEVGPADEDAILAHSEVSDVSEDGESESQESLEMQEESEADSGEEHSVEAGIEPGEAGEVEGDTDAAPDAEVAVATADAEEAPESEEAEEETPPGPGVGRPDFDGSWYVVHTYSGFEKKVKESLDQRIKAFHLEEDFGEVLIPTEDVVEVKAGKKVITPKKFFPGYILVQIKMSDEAWHVVKSTPKVTGFVGSGGQPTPISQAELDLILNQMTTAQEKPKPKFVFNVGETVRIIDGPFSNFSGMVDQINLDRSTIRVMVSIFGRSTPVELSFLQVEKS